MLLTSMMILPQDYITHSRVNIFSVHVKVKVNGDKKHKILKFYHLNNHKMFTAI